MNIDDIKAIIVATDWTTSKIKTMFSNLEIKNQIELILDKIIKNNYCIDENIRSVVPSDFGFYEKSWGEVIRAMLSYPIRCKAIIELAKKRNYIKYKPKNKKCKVKIHKITNVNDCKWGFSTIKRLKPRSDGKEFEFCGAKIFADPSVPKGTVLISLEDYGQEALFAVFDKLLVS